MTDSMIESLQQLRNRLYNQIPAKHEQEKKAIEMELDAAQAQCDHKYPDGSSAIVGSLFCRSCTICCWNDL